jgi:hypothetical protein
VDESPDERIETGDGDQRDLERLKKEIRPGIDRFDRGEPGKSFDAEDVKHRGRERLVREGITDKTNGQCPIKPEYSSASANPRGHPAAP